MSYQRDSLGQDEDVIWTNIDWSIPGGGPGAIYTPSSPIDWPSIDWTKGQGVQITTPTSTFPTTVAKPSGDWWSSITGALVPLSQAAANIIRASTGQAPPPGTMYDPRTGRYITPQQAGFLGGTNWLLPALLLGGGAILLLRRRR